MVRVRALVEGQTEEAFVDGALCEHLAAFGVSVEATIVTTSRERGGRRHKGGGHWGRWASDLARLLGSDPGAHVTTMLDLYGLPAGFPDRDRVTAAPTADEKVALAEAQLLAAASGILGDDYKARRRFIPYVQRHEFEALVLARLDALRELLDPPDHPGLDKLRAEVGDTPPEDVNDGAETAPSKRLARHIRSYDKVFHGGLVTGDMPRLLATCPHFARWVARLAALGDAR